MIGEPSIFRSAFSLLRDPVTAEKQRIMDERWQTLPASAKLPTQGLGRKATGCGATVGIQPKCDFSCTGCYLGAEANRIPALPLEAVLAQLDALRAYLGPKSNIQITDGEVTLRPVDELIAVLRRARSIGAIPMVMTHGDNLRRQPGLLERLMVEGMLTEISIHVDITQRGRDGYRAPKSELELMPLREEFANMIRAARRSTRQRLRAAMTLTVTSENLPQIADVVRWVIANRDVFSLISFQPLAQVGRTRKALEGVTPAALWREVSKATADYGLDVDGTGPLHFGHPDCTAFVPLIAIERKGRTKLMRLIRNDAEDAALVDEYSTRRLAGVAFRDDRPAEMIARGAGMLVRQPRFLLGRARRWANARLREEVGATLASLAVEALTGRARVDGVTLTSHHFMSPAELATPEGEDRLAACVFRLPYNGEMVPMCRMNAGGVRDAFYAELERGNRSSVEGAPH